MTSTWHIHVRWMSRLLCHQNTITFYTHLKVDMHTNSPFVSSYPGIFRLQHRKCQWFSCYISLPCHEWSDVAFITFPQNQCRYYFNDPSQLPFWASFYNPVKHGYILTPNYNLCCKRRVRWRLWHLLSYLATWGLTNWSNISVTSYFSWGHMWDLLSNLSNIICNLAFECMR